MTKIFRFILKVFTHNYCDTCGFTKNKVYITEHFMESGFKQCKKCISMTKIKEAAEKYGKLNASGYFVEPKTKAFIAGATSDAAKEYHTKEARELIEDLKNELKTATLRIKQLQFNDMKLDEIQHSVLEMEKQQQNTAINKAETFLNKNI